MIRASRTLGSVSAWVLAALCGTFTGMEHGWGLGVVGAGAALATCVVAQWSKDLEALEESES